MVISVNEDFRSGPYQGNGVATQFDYDFKIYEPGDLLVTCLDLNGDKMLLVLGTDYSVQGAGQDGGGHIVLTAPLVAGFKLVIEPNVARSQTRPLSMQTSLHLSETEQALDKLTSLVRQVQGPLNRSFKVDAFAGDDFVPELPPPPGPDMGLFVGPDGKSLKWGRGEGDLNAIYQAVQDAQAARDAAQLAAAQAALFDGPWLDSVAALLADTGLTYTPDQPGTVTEGDIVRTRAEGFSYQVLPSGAADYDIVTEGGILLRVLGRTEAFAQWGITPVDEQVNLYCDPVAGLDSNPGTLEAPLRTIAAAVRRVPRLIDLVRVNINLHAAPRARGATEAVYDEDVLVSDIASRGTGDRDDGVSGNRGRLFIHGDAGDRDYVKIGSFTATSCSGRDNPTVMYVRLERISPFDVNEEAACAFVSCQMGSAWGLSFAPGAGIKKGIQSYGSGVDSREIDVTNLTEAGAMAKRGGRMLCRDFLGTFDPTSPNANTSAVYFANEGSEITFFDDGVTLASGARRHHGRYGSKTIWARQNFALVGETNSEERRQNTCFKIGLTSNYSTFTSTSVQTLPFNLVHIDNASGPSYSGVDTANNRLLISPFAGIYRLEASVRVQFAGAAVEGDVSTFDLLIEDGEETVVARASAALWKHSAAATHQTIRCFGFVTPGNTQQARFRCRIIDGSGRNNIIVADAAETYLVATLVG